VGENLRFLTLEVEAQVRRVAEYIDLQDPALAQRIFDRDDYIDQLKSRIERKCFELATEISTESTFSLEFLKALEITAVNLERIADFCGDIIGHLALAETGANYRRRLLDCAELVIRGINRIEEAMRRGDVDIALDICEREVELDRLYAEALRDAKSSLGQGSNVEEDVAFIFVAHYFERMGDSLLNIGESIISVFLGERVKIPQIGALESAFGDASLDTLSLEDMAETKSGCTIARVTRSNDRRMIIFKEGKRSKLAKEKACIDEWHTLFPGLVPKIYSFHGTGESGAILYEYLPGNTIEELLLRPDEKGLFAALEQLTDTLGGIWSATKTGEPAKAGFIQQLRSRLPDVYTIHPDFRRRGFSVGEMEFSGLDALLAEISSLDEKVIAPFSVFIHGDMNIDNVIYDSSAPDKPIRLIDVHRSRMMDYVQDVSVLLVSGQRLQVFAPRVRRRINAIVVHLFDFAREFARQEGDATFELRLALGLARSLATSTRFVLDQNLAKNMFFRAEYLLEHISRSDLERPEEYRLPLEVLVD
jgi:phosphate uptake regulator